MRRVESQVTIPVSLNGSDLADWAEAAIFIEQRDSLSKSVLRQRLRTTHISEDEGAELLVDLVLSEVAHRSRLAPETYPFDESATGISRKHIVEESLYEFLLWLSVSPRYRSENRYHEIEEPFDQIVKQALISYLGEGAKGIRFAHPSSNGRPPNFPDAIRWLAALLNLSTGPASPRTRLRDAGVDVVVWRPFRDSRSGFLSILCQCTVEENWTPKAKDISLGNWLGFIDFGLRPTTVLAVPFAVPINFEKWDQVRRDTNIILDRFRLCELIQPKYLQNIEAIRNWANNERCLLTQIYES